MGGSTGWVQETSLVLSCRRRPGFVTPEKKNYFKYKIMHSGAFLAPKMGAATVRKLDSPKIGERGSWPSLAPAKQPVSARDRPLKGSAMRPKYCLAGPFQLWVTFKNLVQ